ncbi:MAG: zinc ribbon domain-containing protein [Treponema sp.]|jgi:putative FmdB family regulatory protein|nr:zinc ribbon domain-containing protein [Treponema sp.]
MPTYEYECTSCGHTFDVFQRMSEAPLTTCPQCGQTLRRLINGGSGIIFKGPGFYVTDKQKGATRTASSAKGTSGEGQESHKEVPAASSEQAKTGTEQAQGSGSGHEKKMAG